MTENPITARCECGATAGPLGVCADYYHQILSDEQADPQMYSWHTPVVLAYLLQHPSRAREKYLDGQFRQLQLYVDKGLDALLRVAAHQVARNRHGSQSGYDMAPLEPYEPLPAGGPPARFRTGFSALPVREGSFVADGHAAYGRHIELIAEATVEAWRSLQS
ncbi:hypothetical protein HTZ77_43665 [Nonomuraea sp. SMC257]|uniref:Uncharacterized protein n=1 Tax=Nonomuraea montanisoli TaxID=2741721 RepID=A0A7Y6M875_9ACTN|nr:DUF5946 family protein [Nonomuraea montanisoli]NUW38252.1 hypothetical protein [Nonomuraea montanisoli]